MTLWDGRFTGRMDSDAFRFNSSIGFDVRLAAQDIQGSEVWAKGLEKAGILSTDETRLILDGLHKIKEEFSYTSFKLLDSDEDIHTAIERRLIEIIGPVGGKLHTGRSRNDQVATDFRLWIRDHLPILVNSIKEFQQILIKKAETDIGIIMPGYSHFQPGQPVLLSHWWLSFFWPFHRDRRRLDELLNHISVLPLGSGAFAGTSFPIDREFLADELGFLKLSQNSIDGVSDRDFVAEFLFICSLIAIHITKLSEAMILFSNPQFGFFRIPDPYSTGSSLMPQKKNPDIFELARGKCGGVIGSLTGFLSTLKGLPSSYDKDLQEDKIPVFSVFDTLNTVVRIVGKTTELTIAVPEAMEAALSPELMATDLADYLVMKGIPFRESHSIVGKLVRLAESNNVELKDLPLEDFKDASDLIEQDVFEVFKPKVSIGRKNCIGGTSEAAVRNQTNHAKACL